MFCSVQSTLLKYNVLRFYNINYVNCMNRAASMETLNDKIINEKSSKFKIVQISMLDKKYS